MDAELARRVGCAADDHGLAAPFGMMALLGGRIEGIHIDMEAGISGGQGIVAVFILSAR